MSANQEQIDFWNGEAAQRWVDNNNIMETMLKPIGMVAIDAAAPQPGEQAMDIGCGCGNQTLELARRIGHAGHVLGVDISAPMLALARAQNDQDQSQRASVEFLQADAAEHAFAPDSRDLLFSRFGVMFFADPVIAFANLRTALRRDGRLSFCCWRPLKENDFMYLPLAAALQHVPAPEPMPPHAPGPFAFADSARVREILTQAGYANIRIEGFEQPQIYGAGLTLEESSRRLMELGPVGRLLIDAPQETVDAVHRSVMAALAPHADENGIALLGRCWLVQASSP